MSRDMNPFLWMVSSLPAPLCPSLLPSFPACLPCLPAFTHWLSTNSMPGTVLGTEENKAKSCSHDACLLVGETHCQQENEGKKEGRKFRGYENYEGNNWVKENAGWEGGGPWRPGKQMLHTHFLPKSCPCPVCCRCHCPPRVLGFLSSLNSTSGFVVPISCNFYFHFSISPVWL